ncbi:MAG: helicase SNF2, partial [Bacteroidota bacterium]|nr:helicase SNF2 [Bacteroidota bacterium]
MALPYLTKHIYNNGTDEVIRRGKKIYSLGNVEMIDFDDLLSTVVFRVKDDTYNTYYKVHIQKFKDEKNISIRCGCPYNLSEICRHEAACLFQLQDLLDKNLLGEKNITYNQRHTVVKMKQLDFRTLKLLSSIHGFTIAEEFLTSSKPVIKEAKNERVLAEVKIADDDVYSVLIQKNEERNLDTSCNCNTETGHPLCVHKTIVLLHLYKAYGANYFDSIRNWDKEKNKLLSLYGYSLDDDIKNKFEFLYKEGKPFLRVLDPAIKRVAQVVAPVAHPVFEKVTDTPDVEIAVGRRLKLGLVISYNPHNYPYVQFDAVQGEANDDNSGFAGKVERIDIAKFVNTEVFEEDDKTLLQNIRKLQGSEVSRYLDRNSPFTGIWENIIQQHDDELPEETRQLIIEYLHPKLKKLFTDVAESNFTFFLPRNKTFTTTNLNEAACSINFITPEIAIRFENGEYEMLCNVRTPLRVSNIKENALASSLLFQQEDQFYVWHQPEDVLLVEKFLPSGKINIPENDWNKTLQDFILPLTKEYQVHFSNIQKEEVRDVKPEIKILLKEKGDYLLFQPVFTYHGYDTKPSDKENILLPQANKLMVIHRNLAIENAF